MHRRSSATNQVAVSSFADLPARDCKKKSEKKISHFWSSVRQCLVYEVWSDVYAVHVRVRVYSAILLFMELAALTSAVSWDNQFGVYLFGGLFVYTNMFCCMISCILCSMRYFQSATSI